MNLRQLEYFLTLAETEHMTKAAKELKTSQPNISHAMSSLEQELGIALFEKEGRNIKLSRYGKIFYSYVAPSLKEIGEGQKFLQEIAKPTTTEIKFGFIYTMGSKVAPKIVKDFIEEHPEGLIQFEFFQGTSAQMIQMLKDDVIDVGICSKVQQSSEIQYSIIYQEKLVLVVPEKHPLALLEQTYLADIINYPLVYFTKYSGLRTYLDEVMTDLDLHPKIACELDEDHSVLGFVENNFGIAIMPDIPSISSYKVKKIEIEDSLPDRNIFLATRKNKIPLPIVKEFWDFCRHQFRL
ncbi:LysR family transcriptional regulator [Enterococcus sp. ALS3]|uniref:LysR family transcriptional regulator n=1 Tax=Enterococcus alishanensis TaxID=1303817 RepID=A0ABS6T9S0_9ENTE|nr:LysR family transcriptional regulator [Enterococcus alishanensis]MBV7389651.1 LysR family transcriptional regulator [Enterococcus alishanensis]